MKKFKKIIAMCMTAAMALSMMSVGAFAAETEVTMSEFPETITVEREVIEPDGSVRAVIDNLYFLGLGYINANGVNLRSGPSTSYASLGLMYYGDAVGVYGDMTVSGPWLYAYVNSGNCDGKSGYVYDDYITISSIAKSADVVAE